MTARLAATLLIAIVVTALLPLSPAIAADCAAFGENLARADALDKLNTKAFEGRRNAEACRLMAETNAIRDDILKTTHDDCYTAERSKFAIKMNRETTAAVFRAMCAKP